MTIGVIKMGMIKDLVMDVVELYNDGYSETAIANELKMPLMMVKDIVREYADTWIEVQDPE
jgi:orotate phosphoribosyltransferase-like protein